MSAINGKNIKVNENGIVAEVDALAARLGAAQTSGEAKKIQGQLAALMGLAGGSSAALSAISKAISSSYGVITQLEKAEHEALYASIMNSQFLDADTKNLYEGVDKLMTKEEVEFLNKIDPEKYYDVHTFDKNGNVNGTKKVQGWELQEAFILLKANANKAALNTSQLNSLNQKLYDTTTGPFNLQQGEARISFAQEMIGGRLSANPADRAIYVQQANVMSKLVDYVVPVISKSGFDEKYRLSTQAETGIERNFHTTTITAYNTNIRTNETKKAHIESSFANEELVKNFEKMKANISKSNSNAQANNEITPEEEALMENLRNDGFGQAATTFAMVKAKTTNTPPTPQATAPTIVAIPATAVVKSTAQHPAPTVSITPASPNFDTKPNQTSVDVKPALTTITSANAEAMAKGFLSQQQPAFVAPLTKAGGTNTEAIVAARPVTTDKIIEATKIIHAEEKRLNTLVQQQVKVMATASPESIVEQAELTEEAIMEAFSKANIGNPMGNLQLVREQTAQIGVIKADPAMVTAPVAVQIASAPTLSNTLVAPSTPKIVASTPTPPSLSMATPGVAISANDAGVIVAPSGAIPTPASISTPSSPRLEPMPDTASGLPNSGPIPPVSTRNQTPTRH